MRETSIEGVHVASSEGTITSSQHNLSHRINEISTSEEVVYSDLGQKGKRIAVLLRHFYIKNLFDKRS